MSASKRSVRSPTHVQNQGPQFDREGKVKCYCNPQLPAAYRKVIRESPNTGRWYYNCQRKTNGGCSFFMWEDEVKPSELKVNILNGHELPPPESPSRSSRYLARGSITRSSSFSSDIGTITTAVTSPATSKKRSYTEDSDTEVDELDAYTSDGEWTVIETVMRRRNSKSMGPPKTPRKERRTSTMPSPSKLRATVGRIEGSRQDSKEENIFTTPSASSSRTGLFSRMSESPNSISHSRIPNSSNYSSNDPTTIWENSSTCAPSHTYPSTPLSREFAAILRQNSCQLPKSLEASLESLLDRYWKQAEGYRRARDLIRQHYQTNTEELKNKSKELTALQERIATLEAEKEMERVVNMSLRSKLEGLSIDASSCCGEQMG